MIERYENLPTYISMEKVLICFQEILNESNNNDSKISNEEIIDCFAEISDQAWHQYEIIPIDMRNKIESWLIKNLNPEIENEFEWMLFFWGILGLKKQKLQTAMALVKNETLIIEGSLLIQRSHGDIVNPYYGMS